MAQPEFRKSLLSAVVQFNIDMDELEDSYEKKYDVICKQNFIKLYSARGQLNY